MDLNWLQSVFYGLLSGLTEILPVSAQAHKVLLLKFWGVKGSSDFMQLMIHLGICAALYYSNQPLWIRMKRARALARIPKKKRKRPLDLNSLMDWRMLLTMLVPAVLGIYLYSYAVPLQTNLIWITLFLFLNGVLLYVPQFFPTGNRDSRTLSRIEGLLLGLGSTVSVLPGISGVGATLSIGSLCGVERTYGLNMTLLMYQFFVAGMAVYDGIGIAQNGFGVITFGILLQHISTAAAAFFGTWIGVKVMRQFTQEHGLSLFGIYCWGLALFTFILNLMA